MSTFIATFITIAVAFSALAIGLILRNKPIEGSCGGVMTSEDGTCSISVSYTHLTLPTICSV